MRLHVLAATTLVTAVGTAHTGSADSPAPPRVTAMLESGQETVRIVCFGDSITGVYYHTGGRRAWCDMLGIALARIYPNAKLEMINAGISGNTTAAGLARMEKDVLAHKPHLVIAMFGMNDCPSGKPGVFGDNLKTIVHRSRAVGAEVVLCTPNSIYPEDQGRDKHLADFAEAVRKVAAEMSVPLADCYKAYEDLHAANPLEWKLLMSETIHPGMNGHKLFAEVIAEAMSGKRVKLDDVGPLPTSLAFTYARLQAGKPLSVIAMPPYDRLMPDALRKIRPDAVINVTVWPTAPAALGPMEKWSAGIRAKKPDLVVVGVPAAADAPSEEQFIRSYNWILDYALAFGRQEWDTIAILPSMTDGANTSGREPLARRVILSKDIGFIERPDGDTSPAADVLYRWFQEQYKTCSIPAE
ncbi:MAG: hypothetical protein A3K19_07820 [Lentisphaerae bacterium RIFOXYB12_FULL_65_16]|nr:MAG: hypothetical protein A3K18_07325 [Lentisphaerae bacterium RIFOXYA12_64_32]OGV87554.1 MAG: hypothetical protein A3K19_07820 [Lentisphaerae bacterium RIFOXYB12_FULL_65_16]